jgi:hypothetical protein
LSLHHVLIQIIPTHFGAAAHQAFWSRGIFQRGEERSALAQPAPEPLFFP